LVTWPAEQAALAVGSSKYEGNPMKCRIVVNVVLVTSLSLWLGSSLRAAENSRRQSRLSFSDLERKTLAELEQEQARLTRLLSDVDPFQRRPESWQSTVEHLAKARAMGEIVRLRYLVRALDVSGAPAPKRKGPPVKIELPNDPLRITVVQRRSKAVPGFHGAVTIRIGDITHGQVLLEIVSEDVLRPVVDTHSVQEGDVTPFKLGSAEYYLSVVELRNFLIGDDFAVFEISTKRPDESSKIEQLLNTIETSGLVFIRNDSEATAAEAAAHLRTKWRSASPRITTAESFIRRIASRSSVTGKPYQVKRADGSVIEAATWLREQLEEAGQQAEPE
jgi:hypothetical protein